MVDALNEMLFPNEISKKLIGQVTVVSRVDELNNKLDKEIKTIEELSEEIEVMKKKTKKLTVALVIVSLCLIAGLIILWF